MPINGLSDTLRPALDFLQRMRQRHSDVPFLDDDELQTLDQILKDGITYTPSEAVQLERRAHAFLVKLEVKDDLWNFLDFPSNRKEYTERKELADLINPPAIPSMSRTRPQLGIPRIESRPHAVAAAVGAVVIAIGLSVGLPPFIHLLTQTGPPAGTAQQNPPAQQVPAGPTDLQNLKQDFGPWQQLTPSNQQPETGSPALLLLEDGGFFASQQWTIPARSSSWQHDLGGNVENVDINGNHADITNADGLPYIVGVNQAFVFSANPQTVLKVDSTGTVYSMSLAQATAIRQHI